MATRKDTNLRKRELELAIRGACESGEWAQGDPVPPVRELAARHGLSLAVVNQELRRMVDDGLLNTVPRVGTFVGGPSSVVTPRPAPREGNGFLSNTIILLRRPRNPHYTAAHLVSGISDAMHEAAAEPIDQAGMDVLALQIDRLLDEQTGPRELERVVAQKPYGVVISAHLGPEEEVVKLARAFTGRGIPVSLFDDLGDFDRVVSDHESGAYQLTRWLIERGNRRIRQVWEGKGERRWMQARRCGYERAMLEAGLSPRSGLYMPFYSEWQSIHAFEDQVRGTCGTMIEALRGGQADDALMAPSDGPFYVLAGVCRMLGIEPNRDVAIVGYDNYWRDCPHLASLQCAPLATVEKFNEESGRELVRLLIDRVEGRLSAEPQRRAITPELVVVQQDSVDQVTQVKNSLAAERSRSAHAPLEPFVAPMIALPRFAPVAEHGRPL